MEATQTQRVIVRRLGEQLAKHADAPDFDVCSAILQMEGTAALMKLDLEERREAEEK